MPYAQKLNSVGVRLAAAQLDEAKLDTITGSQPDERIIWRLEDYRVKWDPQAVQQNIWAGIYVYASCLNRASSPVLLGSSNHSQLRIYCARYL